MMEILSFNAGYFLGYRGTAPDYLLHPWTAVTGSQAETARIATFIDVVDDISPDVIALQEVDTGSLRTQTTGQPQYIAERLPDAYDVCAAQKYDAPLLPRLPILEHMANALYCTTGTVKNHYLDNGTKSLVQELQLDTISIFSVHLARFGKRVRKRQLLELAAFADNRDDAVIVGDFNMMTGVDEAAILDDHSTLHISSPGNTFPAHKPSYPLDFAVHSPHLAVQCRQINATISDHTPILVTVEDMTAADYTEKSIAAAETRKQD
jgi:endonuclease/exonuclease/phosphatase family metal-dependent hydrolase